MLNERSRNFPTLLRNEIYRKIYEKEMYPKDIFLSENPKTRISRDPLEGIKRNLEEGVYKYPKTMPDYLK